MVTMVSNIYIKHQRFFLYPVDVHGVLSFFSPTFHNITIELCVLATRQTPRSALNYRYAARCATRKGTAEYSAVIAEENQPPPPAQSE